MMLDDVGSYFEDVLMITLFMVDDVLKNGLAICVLQKFDA